MNDDSSLDECPSSDPSEPERKTPLIVDRPRFFNASLDSAQNYLFRFVIFVRAFIFLLQLFFSFWNFSTDAFKGIPLVRDKQTLLDFFLWRSLRGFFQWDSVHMIHIAEHGYVLESSLAFFPFFPLLIRYLSYPWAFPFIYFGFMHSSSAFLLTAVVLNNICFCMAAFVLHSVVLSVTRSHKQAVISTILYAINPASVFFSSAYTESLFALLTFTGIWFFVSHDASFPSRFASSVFCFSLSYATRSNGFLNLGYVGFYCLLRALFPEGKGGQRVLVLRHGLPTVIASAVTFVFQIAVALVGLVLFVFIHGNHQQHIFCNQASAALVSPSMMSLAKDEGVATMGQTDEIDWCLSAPLLFPPFYSSIQRKYWNVSWFGYWKLSKIPCFLLAAPSFFIIAYGVFRIFKEIERRDCDRFLADKGGLLPFALHSLLIGLGSLFLWNSEVLTRLLFSSSPFPYLVLSAWMAESTPRARLSDLLEPYPMPFVFNFCRRGRMEMAVFLFFISYAFVGTIFHVMGLPFT